MIIFIKKIKTKEGINALNFEKIKKDIPEGYQTIGNDPLLSITANHVVVAFKCQEIAKPADKPKSVAKPKAKVKSKKIIVAKV